MSPTRQWTTVRARSPTCLQEISCNQRGGDSGCHGDRCSANWVLYPLPTSIMTASQKKGGSTLVRTRPAAEDSPDPSGAMLLTAFRRDDCQATIFVNPIRTCDDHLVWLSFSIEPIDDDVIGRVTFERPSIGAMRLLLRDVEHLVYDIEDEIDLYGRTVDDVIADIRQAGIVSH